MQANKSTFRTSLAILAIGVAALLVLVWLSRSPNPAPKVDEATQNTHMNASEANNSDVSTGDAKLATNDGTDPFKERLINQQTNKSVNVSDGNSAPIVPLVPVGTDPFKEKLNLQSKQSTQVTVSPFKN